MRISENPLENYFYSNKNNVIHKWVHYLEIYHKHFQRFVGTECVILEIGISKGGSLQMWKNYFGEKAKIYGLDIDPICKKLTEKNIKIFIGSQSDRKLLKELKTKIPKIDILIDDGGHRMDQQIVSFEELFDHINEDGLYLCEDLHTSYWDEYGGGLKNPSSFIEYGKTLIDKLNAWHIRNNEGFADDLTKNINSLHFYDSILVVEKKERIKPWHEMRGGIINSMINPNEYSIEHLKLKLLGLLGEVEVTSDQDGFDELALRTISNDTYEGKIWPKNGETMIGYKRLTNVEFCVKKIIENKIEGDLIETGVWRGGTCIFMSVLLKYYNDNEKIVWAADSFEGLPKPNSIDYPEDSGDNLYTAKELSISLDEVQNNFRKYDVYDNQVRFIKGFFKDTLPLTQIDKLSLLRLDGDMYESTIDALFYLYPKLSLGGYCIVDDWGAIPACKKAVEDYRKVNAIQEEIMIIDWTGIYWKKTQNIPEISRLEFDQIISID